MRNLFILLITLFMVTSCAPSSKEEYLERYKKFMDEVSENYKTYSPEQWEMANEKFARFNNQWYQKFRPTLTWAEKATIAGYQFKYQGLRVACELGTFYDESMKTEMDELRSKVQYYVDNHLEEDLERFLEEVKVAGKAIYEELKRMADEINNNTNQ